MSEGTVEEEVNGNSAPLWSQSANVFFSFISLFLVPLQQGSTDSFTHCVRVAKPHTANTDFIHALKVIVKIQSDSRKMIIFEAPAHENKAWKITQNKVQLCLVLHVQQGFIRALMQQGPSFN